MENEHQLAVAKSASDNTSRTRVKITDQLMLDLIKHWQEQNGALPATSTRLVELTGGSIATVKRVLKRLLDAGLILREGKARSTRYMMPPSTPEMQDAHMVAEQVPPWPEGVDVLRQALQKPLIARPPSPYRRTFVDGYVPNKSFLLPPKLARELTVIGRMPGHQPAGTYAQRVLEQLLIDLSWSSSNMEGNTLSRLATEELFLSGISGKNGDAVMLINHKNAIEFMVAAVPEQGLTVDVIRNLHAALMQDLLPDSDSLGGIRRKPTNVRDTVYLPCQVPSQLNDMLARIVDKARLIKNPIEAAFFLWINIAYLQPFEDGNKRTSRLAANIPLMQENCAPLSFLDVDPQDYADAMIGVYEFRNVALAVELFDWTYRRGCKKYAVALQTQEASNPMRFRYRGSLNEAIGQVVREGKSVDDALVELQFTEDRLPGFASLLRDELRRLEAHNCARYRLTMGMTSAWIKAGRPS